MAVNQGVSSKMIQTKRLTIRFFEEQDRPGLVELLMDPYFMEHSETGALDAASANSRFDQILSFGNVGLGKRAVLDTQSGELYGYCGIEPFELNRQIRLELGYRIALAHRQKGIATEAASAVASTHAGKLYAYVNSSNLASIRVLERIGFNKSGTCLVHGKQYALFNYSGGKTNNQGSQNTLTAWPHSKHK